GDDYLQDALFSGGVQGQVLGREACGGRTRTERRPQAVRGRHGDHHTGGRPFLQHGHEKASVQEPRRAIQGDPRCRYSLRRPLRRQGCILHLQEARSAQPRPAHASKVQLPG
ncbi:unnamed protein product, partial [Ectocarpus sp. 8 AP-2014]